MSVTAAARRAARATWEIAITRESSARRDEDEHDDLYWLSVHRTIEHRLTWDLSRELYSLAARNRGVFDEETGTFEDVERRRF